MIVQGGKKDCCRIGVGELRWWVAVGTGRFFMGALVAYIACRGLNPSSKHCSNFQTPALFQINKDLVLHDLPLPQEVLTSDYVVEGFLWLGTTML